MQHAIEVSVTPETPWELNNGVITLTDPPQADVRLEVTVDYGQFNPVILATGNYLYTDNTGVSDVNGDGCNTEADFLALAEQWRLPFTDDPDGDGIITVKDFLYLPANQSKPCP
jgi:hypothetical protein